MHHHVHSSLTNTQHNIPSSGVVGVAQPREQISIERCGRLPLLTPQNSPISFLSLNSIICFRTLALITETRETHALYSPLGGDVRGKHWYWGRPPPYDHGLFALTATGCIRTYHKKASYGWPKVSAKVRFRAKSLEYASLTQNTIPKFTQIVRQQPPLISLLFYSGVWTRGFSLRLP